MRTKDGLFFSPNYRFFDIGWNNQEKIIDAFQDRINGFYFKPARVLNQNQQAFAAGLVLDNYRVHKTKLVQKIAEILNINLIFLPPYSPDLNPIEDVWRKINGIISINSYNNVEELKKKLLKNYLKKL